MLKKALIGVGVLLVGAVLWTTTDVGSYVSTAWKQGKAYAKKQVPPEFQIKRAEEMLQNLDKVDDRLISEMARQMVAIKQLQKEVAVMEENVEKQRLAIKDQNDQLKNWTVGRINGQNKDQFALGLERAFKRFRTMEQTVQTKKDLLVQHEERLAATKEQREGLKAQKTDLQARIEGLQTQIALLRAAETRTKCRIDNGELSELAKVKELVDSLEQQLDTQMTELQLREEIKVTAPAPATTSSTSIVQEIDAYFGETGKVAAEK
jgi:chromosome segregation ATPase